MFDCFRQFIYLVWKNFTLQRRRPICTIVEFVVPLIFFAILIATRQTVDIKHYGNATQFKAFVASESRLPPNDDGSYPDGLAFTPDTKDTREIMTKACDMLSWNKQHCPTGFDTVKEMEAFLLFENTTFHNWIDWTLTDDFYGNQNPTILYFWKKLHAKRGHLPWKSSNIVFDLDHTAVNNTRDYVGGIVFSLADEASSINDTRNLSFSIRLAYKPRPIKGSLDEFIGGGHQWHTNLMFPLVPELGPRKSKSQFGADPGYVEQGFIAIEWAVGKSWLLHHADSLNRNASILNATNEPLMRRFPYPPYTEDPYTLAIQMFFPLALMWSFLIIILQAGRDVAQEKERKLKETMKLMGVPNYVHWLAWWFKYIVMMLFSVTLMTVLLLIKINDKSLLNNSDTGVMFVYLMLYGISSLSFGFMIAGFFKSANIATAAVGILFFLSYQVYSFTQPYYADLSLWAKIFLCLFNNLAMSFGAKIIGIHEANQVGVQWSTLDHGPSSDDPFSMQHVFIMFIIDTVLYFIITWYIENVKPGEFGLPRPFYFPFLPSYWCGTNSASLLCNSCRQNSQTVPLDLPKESDESYFEREPADVMSGIETKNLSKLFGNKIAVSRLNLKLYEGQITALLGRNGAGKTTTMFMLTGFIPPSFGSAELYGLNILEDMDVIRNHLGYCPQHDVLFNLLTVREHLKLFAKLRGTNVSDVDIINLLTELRLDSKIDALGETLSGGQRRKLSVAIALILDSKIIILDEPTTGMDPEARRITWDVLQRYRPGRTILLTTHYMDEADFLGDSDIMQLTVYTKTHLTPGEVGLVYTLALSMYTYNPDAMSCIDEATPFHACNEMNGAVAFYFKAAYLKLRPLQERIAIMSFGVLKCCGSSLFLKNKYGTGYHMIMVKRSGCDVTAIFNVIQRHVTNAKIESNVSAELSFILPHESSSHFEQMFRELEESQDDLGIASFGVSVTTMEEVFLKVSNQDDDHHYGEPAAQSQPSSIQAKQVISQKTETFTNHSDSLGESSSNVTVNNLPDICLTLPSAESTTKDNCPLINDLTNTSDTAMPSDVSSTSFCSVQCLDSPNFFESTEIWFYKFCALFLKRFLYSWRNRLSIIIQLIIPAVIVTVSMGILKAIPSLRDIQPLLLDLHAFDEQIVPISYVPNYPSNVLSSAYAEQSGFTLKNNLQTKRFLAAGSATVSPMESYLLNRSKESLGSYNEKYMIASEFKQSSEDTAKSDVAAYFNNQAYHTPGITIAALLNSFTVAILGKNYTLSVINHPLPPTARDQWDNVFSEGLEASIVAGNQVFGMAFLMTSFIIFLVIERASKAKHLQYVSGAGTGTFWLATFLWDLINFSFPLLLMYVIYAAFMYEPIILHTGPYLTLNIVYAAAILPQVYLFSFIFESPTTAFVAVILFNIFTSNITLITVSILRIPGLGTSDVADGLDWAFLVILPNYSFAQGLQSLIINHMFNKACNRPDIQIICRIGIQTPCCLDHCGDNCVTWNANYWDWKPSGIGRFLTFMGISCSLYWSSIILLESGILFRLCSFLQKKFSKRSETITTTAGMGISSATEPSSQYEDSDVADERKRINDNLENLLTNHAVLMKDLTKYYGGKSDLPAVDHLSFGVEQNVCFGLLGVNGAGKTTTFKILTGDAMMSSGAAYISGMDVQKNIINTRKLIGYCPQFDALIDHLTGYETLSLFSRLRGIPSDQISSHIKFLSVTLGLEPYANRLVKTYSGGNKRKLSAAIAIVGNPQVIFLDEPTAGMDPVARRRLWNVLSWLRENGDHTLILTSHSMEECEALCTRIGIMVNGRFQCLGSSQHLKSRFGEGFAIVIKSGDSCRNMNPIKEHIAKIFPDSVLRDEYQGFLEYHIVNRDLSWSFIFSQMEKIKISFELESYSVSQSSLEQIFLSFARKQKPETPVHKNSCLTCGCCRG